MADDPELQRQLLKHMLRPSDVGSVDGLQLDAVTSLPGLPFLVRRVEHALKSRKSLGILTVNIAQFTRLEDIYGWQAFDEIVRGVAACLKTIKDESLRDEDALAELTLNGNVFILMLSPPRTKRALRFADLARIKVRISAKLNEYVARALNPELLYRFNCFIGCAVMKADSSVRLERLLFRCIDEALEDGSSEREKRVRERSRALKRILDARRISTLYQPLLDLRSRSVLGWEALSRGPKGEFRAPDVLFQIAYQAELVLKLDGICREKAVRGLTRMRDDALLFINMEPLSTFDPTLVAAIPARRVKQIVFEITEHAAISDFPTFRQAIQLLKQAGFKVAIDDVGSAYSGLRIISEIEPDFIKLDMELTRGAHANRVKMELVRAIARFGEEARIPMIAEGVQTAEELGAVTSLGIHLVQGFIFGQPAAVPQDAGVAWPDFPTAG